MDGRTGGAGAAAAQGQELVARPHPEHRQGALIGVDGQAEEFLVERDGALLIGHEDREVVVVAQAQQALGRRRLGGLETHVPQHPRAAAVGAVLKLQRRCRRGRRSTARGSPRGRRRTPPRASGYGPPSGPTSRTDAMPCPPRTPTRRSASKPSTERQKWPIPGLTLPPPPMARNCGPSPTRRITVLACRAAMGMPNSPWYHSSDRAGSDTPIVTWLRAVTGIGGAPCASVRGASAAAASVPMNARRDTRPGSCAVGDRSTSVCMVNSSIPSRSKTNQPIPV